MTDKPKQFWTVKRSREYHWDQFSTYEEAVTKAQEYAKDNREGYTVFAPVVSYSPEVVELTMEKFA